MAIPFEPDTSATQSSNGLVITFTDISPYGSANTEGYVKSDFTTNTLVIYNAYGEIIQTSNFLASDTITYTQTKDTWFTTIRTMAGISSYERTQKFPDLNRITTNKLEDVLSSGCCQGATNEANLCKVNTFMQDALYSSPIGASVRWQTDIDNANSYLDIILL